MTCHTSATADGGWRPRYHQTRLNTMTNTTTAFGDWGNGLMSLDLTKGTEAIFEFMAKLDVPGVNMDALVASQRDNLEALTAANQAAVDGFKAAAQWQQKIFQETLRELGEAITARSHSVSPQPWGATEAELMKKAFETAVRQMRELAEIVTAANQQAIDAIGQRIPEALGEIKDILKM
jgi:phasin family protein